MNPHGFGPPLADSREQFPFVDQELALLALTKLIGEKVRCVSCREVFLALVSGLLA
jgi:hypothetical protein